MDAVLLLSVTVGIESACDALGVARASFYRQRPLLGPALSAYSRRRRRLGQLLPGHWASRRSKLFEPS